MAEVFYSPFGEPIADKNLMPTQTWLNFFESIVSFANNTSKLNFAIYETIDSIPAAPGWEDVVLDWWPVSYGNTAIIFYSAHDAALTAVQGGILACSWDADGEIADSFFRLDFPVVGDTSTLIFDFNGTTSSGTGPIVQLRFSDTTNTYKFTMMRIVL